MKLSEKHIDKICPESEIYEKLLSLDGKKIMELGCGNAEITRTIATNGHDREIIAMEVDEIQHHKNLLIDDLVNVTFKLGGGEAIGAADETFDVVLMFKSLHHVPMEFMGKALREIRRVLKPGGLAYISEPIFAGDFNEILRLFHDEQEVRTAAFRAIENSINEGIFSLVDEIFFNVPMLFENFAEFENKILKVTHTNHQLSSELYNKVKEQFSFNLKIDGARFLIPIRVDLLKR